MGKTKTAKVRELPKIDFASKAAEEAWQDFGATYPTCQGHMVQDYARTFIILMQAFLKEKPTSTIYHAVNFAKAEAYSNNLTQEQREQARDLIEKCWIHGDEFSACLDA